MNAEPRQFLQTSSRSRNEARDLIQTLFVAELISPGQELWLISPWISDIEAIDNTSGAFASISAIVGSSSLTLTDVLIQLVDSGTNVSVVTRPKVSESFIASLKRERSDALSDGSLRIIEREALHTKGILGDDYCLSGSMNFTFHGLLILDEMLTFHSDQRAVGQLRLAIRGEYGGTS